MTALLERWETCGDRRQLFLQQWAAATDSVLLAARNGFFRDPEWVVRLVDQLSDYYFITVEPDGDDLSWVTPSAWRAAHAAAFDSASPPRVSVLLGYNAHVSNDLAQAIRDVLGTEWPLGNVRLERRYQDFSIAADIITTSAGADAEMVAAWLHDVWAQALTLLTAVDDGWRDAIRECIEHTAARRAHLLACDIDGREELVTLPGHRLDKSFPARHGADRCRLDTPLPAWGAAAPAAS